ncbi:hypothetical protein RND81_14G247300 [Saponaria officinalis]|uniref:Uncharacterized protein n=1 Tax=Saponaria officinalis TaxID=3572 RepID=A0AAW1GUC9_SAPOF
MNDEVAKAMRVIRLKDEECKLYLTAGDDQVSVTLTKPETEGYNPKNTEWRVEWLNNSPKGLVGQVRLWSIHNKALTFAHDVPGDLWLSFRCDALTQQSWPPSHGGGEVASEWQLEFIGKSTHALKCLLIKWSKKYGENLTLKAKTSNIDNDKTWFTFATITRTKFFKWLTWKWLVEVVVVDNNDNNNSTTSTVNQKKLIPPEQPPFIQRQGSANKAPTSYETITPVKNGQESNNHLCHDKSLIDRDTKLRTNVNQKASAPTDPPRSLMQSPVCSKFTPVINDQESNHQIHNKSLVDQEKTQDTSVRKKTFAPLE